jgi:hypothetical protein
MKSPLGEIIEFITIKGIKYCKLSEIERLQAENEKYKTALEFYADKQNWMDDFIKDFSGGRGLIYRGDGGEIASKALKDD